MHNSIVRQLLFFVANRSNQTNLAREGNAQAFKVAMAGRMNPMAIARASAMAYGV